MCLVDYITRVFEVFTVSCLVVRTISSSLLYDIEFILIFLINTPNTTEVFNNRLAMCEV